MAAAGNGGSDGVGDDNDSFPHYPSSYDSANLIAVAVTDHNDSLASFSNFGNISVDLAAPGVSILSTVPFDGYDSFSGTSMATPHASGVAALVYSQFPGLTPAQVKDRILSGVDPVPGLSGVTVTGGRLNAANALTSGPTPGITVSPTSGLVTTEAGGTDAFTVVLDSEPTDNVTIGISSSNVGEGTVSTTTLTFTRPNSSTVGQDWVEVEQSGASVSISGNTLYFGDTSDATNRPLVRRSFAAVSTGTVVWQFDFDWTRSGSENTYRLFMQLGDGAQMSDGDQDAGVGVNLIWTQIGGAHESLGHRASGTNTALVQVSGTATVKIVADLAAHTYDVYIDGALIRSLVPFDNLVSLDTVRFFTDALNEKNFSGQAFDNVELILASA